MVEDGRSTKRVVKRVVKKTVVVRPVQSGTTGTTGTTKVHPSAPKVASPLDRLKAKAANRPRPSIRIPSPPRRPGAGLADRARVIGSRIGEGARDASFTAGEAVRDGAARVRDLRLPHLPPLRAAALTGVVVGVVGVGLGWLCYELFSATRGTTAGGAWGAVALLVVSAIVIVLGDRLLSGFGIEHTGTISFTAVALVIVLVLVFFLELAAGRAAWILVPALCAVTYPVSCRVLTFAADQPQRVS